MLVNEVLGYRLDAKKEQLPATTFVFLGNVEDYYPQGQPADTIILKPKDGRAQAIEDQLASIQAQKKLKSGDG